MSFLRTRQCSIRNSLRALSLLLQYPDPALRDILPTLVWTLDDEAALPGGRRAELRALAAELRQGDPLEVEAHYVELFDRGRATSLHLFEHVHGDSRDRGPAMVDLIAHYRAAGLHFDGNELPDHLCVVLEFASTQPPREAREFLAEMADILRAIFSALRERKSSYATVLAAILELAGSKVEAVPVRAEEGLDESWAEPEVFDGCSTRGQSAPAGAGVEQPIQVVRRGVGGKAKPDLGAPHPSHAAARAADLAAASSMHEPGAHA